MNLIDKFYIEKLWLMIPLIGILILLAIVRQQKSKSLLLIVKGIFNLSPIKQTNIEPSQDNRLNYIVFFLSLILISVLIFSISKLNEHFYLCIIIFIVLSYFFIKSVAIKISGILFEQKKLFKQYFVVHIFYIQIIGIASIPLIVSNIIYPVNFSVMSVSTVSNYSYIIFIVVLFICISLIHLTKGRENKISYLQIILYFCTLEISPLMIIYIYKDEIIYLN